MKKFFIVTLVVLLGGEATAATIDWNWRFEPSSFVVSPTQYIVLTVHIENSSASSSAIYLSGFDFFDGSFGNTGILYDQNGALAYTATILPQPVAFLNPGESTSYFAASLTASGNLSAGSTVTLNPNYYVGVECASQWPCDSYTKLASQLEVNVSTVPLGSASAYFLATLGGLLLRIGRINALFCGGRPNNAGQRA